MTANILFAADATRWTEYQKPLSAALNAAGVDFDLRTGFPPDKVDYIVYAPNSNVRDFTPYTRLKAVLSLWAGVETVTGNETLKVPLARMVDQGLKQGMLEWVTGHVLRHHLGMDAHIVNPERQWKPTVPPLAHDRPVTMLGMGELGRACALSLASIGFPVTGWSRTPRDIGGITCLHGDAGLQTALRRGEIIVLLLPDTPATTHLLNAKAIAAMPLGAVIINPGRGPLIDDDALLDGLDSGQIGHATLDVFDVEPLPEEHPFWTHPRVTITPHIASQTRPETSSQAIAENVRRGQASEPFVHLVDRDLGY
jgi:glyoxylate/hydroxypyruvate reductase A